MPPSIVGSAAGGSEESDILVAGICDHEIALEECGE